MRNNDKNYDLFDNPLVRNILKQMTPEQVEEYKNIGKHLYGSIDFEKSEVLANLPPPLSEALAYVKEGLKSGLLPVDLERDEIILLREVYGKEWYLSLGFTIDDVKDIMDLINEVESTFAPPSLPSLQNTNTIEYKVPE